MKFRSLNPDSIWLCMSIPTHFMRYSFVPCASRQARVSFFYFSLLSLQINYFFGQLFMFVKFVIYCIIVFYNFFLDNFSKFFKKKFPKNLVISNKSSTFAPGLQRKRPFWLYGLIFLKMPIVTYYILYYSIYYIILYSYI